MRHFSIFEPNAQFILLELSVELSSAIQKSKSILGMFFGVCIVYRRVRTTPSFVGFYLPVRAAIKNIFLGFYFVSALASREMRTGT